VHLKLVNYFLERQLNFFPCAPTKIAPAHDATGNPGPSLQLPPIIHRGKTQLLSQDEDRPNKELCMIPKKRYLYSQSNYGENRVPRLPPLYPPHHHYPPPPTQRDTSYYTESDVSVAMILANGFGRVVDEKSSPTPDDERV